MLWNKKDKEDANKWREHQSKLNNEIIDQEWEMTIEVFLKDGDIQYVEWKSQGRKIPIWMYGVNDKASDVIVRSGDQELRTRFSDAIEVWGKTGVRIGDCFYPHSHIKAIQIAEVKKC